MRLFADKLLGQIAAQIDAYIVWRVIDRIDIRCAASIKPLIPSKKSHNYTSKGMHDPPVNSINDNNISHLAGIQDGVLGDPGLEKIM
jgi:hypothetical protein